MRRPLALMTAVIIAGGLALIPATSPALAQTSPVAPSTSKKIQRIEVCFTVHVIGDPVDQQVSGTLFYRRKSNESGRTALLLQHGGVSERSVWDGGRPTVTGVPSMAEQLATAGYDVFAIDRLGYGKSPYREDLEGSGWALTVDSYVEMTHEMVTQIRAGTYKVTDDVCPGSAPAGRPAVKVFLIGQSLGAGISQYYATQYHDIDGIVPMVNSSNWREDGESSTWGDYFINEVWLGQLAQGKDYVYLFSVENGYSQPCEDYLFYPGGVSDDVVEEICGPGYFGGDEPRLMPSGDIATAWPYMQERIKDEIGNVGPTPALLVFADKDFMMTGPEFSPAGEPDVITPEIEMWINRCNCDVDVLWQKGSGHLNQFHDSTVDTTARIIHWLRTRELPTELPDEGPPGDPTPPCPTSEQFQTLGPAGRHEDVTPPVLPGGTPPYPDESATRFTYRLDLSGSADVPDATRATVRVALTWDDLSDFDLYVYNSDGTLRDSSINTNALSGRGAEWVWLFDEAHCTDLRIDVVNFAGSPTSNIDLDVAVTDLA